ncbi:hypothetical protein RW092_22960, partial [Paenibacillus sp. 3LSP]|uniref:hypothetical protein n=1 Tax=Paenibacillus sp. 3LSP TaxID=2800795 RepID=UPI0028FD2171
KTRRKASPTPKFYKFYNVEKAAIGGLILKNDPFDGNKKIWNNNNSLPIRMNELENNHKD